MALKIIRKKAPAPEPVVREKHQPRTDFDAMCRFVVKDHPNAAIAWLLMASYLYYLHDVSLLTDPFYDELAKAVLEAWDDLEHRHKVVMTRDMLEAGSLFQLKEDDYPSMTKGAAMHLVRSEVSLRR